MLYNAVGVYVLVVSLLSVFVIVLLARQGRTRKDVSIWLTSGMVGILLGAAAAGAVVQALGYELSKKLVPLPEGITLASANQESVSAKMGPGMAGMPGMGAGMPGMGAGMPGMGAGMPAGSGGASSCGTGSGTATATGGGCGTGTGCATHGNQAGSDIAPKAQLAILVHKINLLTSDISLRLSDAQAAGLVKILTRIKSQQAISDEEAATLQKQILDQFDVAQKAKPDSIGLPPIAAPGPQDAQGQVANPFQGQHNAQALQSLLDRLSKPAATKPVAAAAR